MGSVLRTQLEKIKELKETSKEVKKLIDNSIITGSYCFGVNSDESDIDVIIMHNSNIKFGEVIGFHNGIYLHEELDNNIEHYFQEDFQSCYVLYNNKIYNLLFMHKEHAYNRWVYATNKMLDKCKHEESFKDYIRDKKIRVSFFEKFKEEYDNSI
jgi:predicted nucleotidyltransferase